MCVCCFWCSRLIEYEAFHTAIFCSFYSNIKIYKNNEATFVSACIRPIMHMRASRILVLPSQSSSAYAIYYPGELISHAHERCVYSQKARERRARNVIIFGFYYYCISKAFFGLPLFYSFHFFHCYTDWLTVFCETPRERCAEIRLFGTARSRPFFIYRR